MHCICVRQTELPGVTSLFADVVYNPERTSRFYFHPLRDLNAYRAAAAQIQFSEKQRAALIEALKVQNAGNPLLDRLAQPDTVAVVTGQQVGLFSGPCYTIYKALHAVRLAEWLTSQGMNAVPVFWLATEDHDFAEVNHAWVFDAANHPHKLEMRRTANGQPVGGVALSAPPVEELRATLHGLPFGEEVADLVEETYRGGNTMGLAFGELLQRLLGDHKVLLLDPMLPEFRRLAAPALRKAVENAEALGKAVLARNRELADAGYHAQVHVEEQTSLVFLLENGKRFGLRRHGAEFMQNGRKFSAAELADRAESLSPNALLRPVVQDSMLPSVAYIGGPAEIAYLGQSQVLYQSILGRMPVAVPRTGFTILDARSQKLMERFGLQLGDFYHGEDALRERIASRLVPSSLQHSVASAESKVASAVEQLQRELMAFDPTLAQALERGGRKIRYQLERIERKTGREALRRDARAAEDAAYLFGGVYPERHLQERLYSILPFLARHGMELVDQVHQAIDPNCLDHRLMLV